jgi:AbrB family looped-hinge helix DNA binding protein
MAIEESHETTVTDRGGINIPADIRSRFDIEPGDKVQFNVLEDGSLEIDIVHQQYGAFEDDETMGSLGGDSLEAHNTAGGGK